MTDSAKGEGMDTGPLDEELIAYLRKKYDGTVPTHEVPRLLATLDSARRDLAEARGLLSALRHIEDDRSPDTRLKTLEAVDTFLGAK